MLISNIVILLRENIILTIQVSKKFQCSRARVTSFRYARREKYRFVINLNKTAVSFRARRDCQKKKKFFFKKKTRQREEENRRPRSPRWPAIRPAVRCRRAFTRRSTTSRPRCRTCSRPRRRPRCRRPRRWTATWTRGACRSAARRTAGRCRSTRASCTRACARPCPPPRDSTVASPRWACRPRGTRANGPARRPCRTTPVRTLSVSRYPPPPNN